MATRVVPTVNGILGGHAAGFDCLDRVYLNGSVHNLEVAGQVVNFLTHHLGFPIPSPAILERIGLRFRKAVAEFAAGNDIPVVRFAKGERKLEVMRPHLDRLAREPAAVRRWPRSGWRRSFSGCSPVAPTILTLTVAGSRVRLSQGRPSGDGVLLLLWSMRCSGRRL